MHKKDNNKGFVTSIILIIIALVGLKYAFHFDIVEYWKSEHVQGYVHMVQGWITAVYDWIDSTAAKYMGKK